jgi:hypothetical protein
MKTSEIEARCHDHESRLALSYLLHRAEEGEWTSEQFTEEFDANDILVAWQVRVSNLTQALRKLPKLHDLNDNEDSVVSDIAAFYDEYPYGSVEKRVHHEQV